MNNLANLNIKSLSCLLLLVAAVATATPSMAAPGDDREDAGAETRTDAVASDGEDHPFLSLTTAELLELRRQGLAVPRSIAAPETRVLKNGMTVMFLGRRIDHPLVLERGKDGKVRMRHASRPSLKPDAKVADQHSND